MRVREFLKDGRALDAYYNAMHEWLGPEGTNAAAEVIAAAQNAVAAGENPDRFGPPAQPPEAGDYGPEAINAAREFILAARGAGLFRDADAACVALCTTLFVTCLAQCGDNFLCQATCAANYAFCIKGCA